MKKSGLVIGVLVISILIVSASLASASWLGDFWARIIGGSVTGQAAAGASCYWKTYNENIKSNVVSARDSRALCYNGQLYQCFIWGPKVCKVNTVCRGFYTSALDAKVGSWACAKTEGNILKWISEDSQIGGTNQTISKTYADLPKPRITGPIICFQGQECKNIQLISSLSESNNLSVYYELWWDYFTPSKARMSPRHCGRWSDKLACTGNWSNTEKMEDSFGVLVSSGPVANLTYSISEVIDSTSIIGMARLQIRTWQKDENGIDWHKSNWSDAFTIKIGCECNSCSDCNAKLNNNSCRNIMLTKNILNETSETSTCIRMVSDKSFDCQGYKIEGVASLRNQGHGIFLDSTSNAQVLNCNLINWSSGIYLISGSKNSIINNIANNNIGLFGDGIFLWSSSRNLLTNNTANNNQRNGIYFFGSSSNNLINNIANNNKQDGIILFPEDSRNNIIISNTANNNFRYGIINWDIKSNNVINDNIAKGNREGGIFTLVKS